MIVEKEEIKYLVSCKHNYNTRRNIGVRQESDIRNRVEQHDCKGFIAFYSVGVTSGLKKKLSAFQSNLNIIEIYLDDVLDIIPTMRGFTLQKYFKRPQEMHNHLVQTIEYKPLICMHEECDKDLLENDQIPLSMAGFYIDEKESIHFIYGCKKCISDYCNYPYWTEISQARYIEQMLIWRSIVDDIQNEGYQTSSDFYKHWALFQEAILQIQIPQGWGRWI